MLTSSKDILNLTLSAAIICITACICLAFYYILSAIRDIQSITQSIHRRFEELIGYFDRVKTKAESTAAATAAVSRAVIEIIEYVKKRRKTKAKNEKEAH